MIAFSASACEAVTLPPFSSSFYCLGLLRMLYWYRSNSSLHLITFQRESGDSICRQTHKWMLLRMLYVNASSKENLELVGDYPRFACYRKNLGSAMTR